MQNVQVLKYSGIQFARFRGNIFDPGPTIPANIDDWNPWWRFDEINACNYIRKDVLFISMKKGGIRIAKSEESKSIPSEYYGTWLSMND